MAKTAPKNHPTPRSAVPTPRSPAEVVDFILHNGGRTADTPPTKPPRGSRPPASPRKRTASATAHRTAPTQPRFIDLFCGIGGFRLAFERAGGRCVFSSDWDKHSRQTYAANFGEEPHGDINAVPVESIPPFDILCAGFPCQPFSLAGVSKKNSLGRKHGFAPPPASPSFTASVSAGVPCFPVSLPTCGERPALVA